MFSEVKTPFTCLITQELVSMGTRDSGNTYSHQKFAAEMCRDNRRRPTMKNDRTMKITLNAMNDGARFSFMSITSIAPCMTPIIQSQMSPDH